MTITEEYAEYCASLTYDDIPEDVVAYAKDLVVDTVGIAIGSVSRAASSSSFLEGVGSLDRAGEGATVLATGESGSPAYAALLNGALAHSLDYDDTHRAASLHPGAPVIPAALATAERTDASGKELLTGIVAGYEVACRLGMAVDPSAHYARGFHGTGTCGLFGATAAAGVVEGLDEDGFVSAFGINGSQASGSLQFLENGGWNKRAHPGFAAHSALISASLARQDFFAASDPIEGTRGFLQGYSDDPAPELATAGLNEEYELSNTAVKPYPCCRYMHSAIDALLALTENEDIDPESVESVTVRIPSAGIDLTGNPTNTYPQSFVDAQFSMPFGAALVICRRDAGVDAFLDEVEGGVADDVKRIIDRTTVTDAAWIDDLYPEQWPAEVEVRTTEEIYERRTHHSKGEPENPLSAAELRAKYEELTEPVLGESKARALRERIRDLDSLSARQVVAPLADADYRAELSTTD